LAGLNKGCHSDKEKVAQMAIPQRDETIEEIKRPDTLLDGDESVYICDECAVAW